jgi:ketosteroid isomerase-like protein
MRLISVIVLTACAFATGAFAQDLEPSLRAALDARTAARRAGDAETYGRYVADDAIFVMASGETQTKATRMALIKGVVSAGPVPAVDQEAFRVFPGAAIRTFRYQSLGQPSPQRWTEVWIKQAGDWKLVAVQLTNIE